jgi:hypothetical protein
MATQSQAQIFATKYAENTASNMLDVIRKIGQRAGRITKIALGVSMPHQIGYILALAVPHMGWTNASQILESITMILLAVGVPIATDLLILNCIETIGAAAASSASRVRAFALMFIPVLASGTVNFLAPAPTLIKVLAAFIVTMVPMAESLRFIRPDFAKIERMETQVAAQVAPLPTEGRRCAPGCKCGRHSRKAPAKRKRTVKTPASAPVSPGEVPLDVLNVGMVQ